ncbi:hypothetical protein ACFCX4_36200 [Kitasatospora sp. NPDC056327]|uniref:hypothetical protein n=1 Tax=Kitasatospora sp. NPDC056327 TaxID=3345785 RepID=UPI0035E386FA
MNAPTTATPSPRPPRAFLTQAGLLLAGLATTGLGFLSLSDAHENALHEGALRHGSAVVAAAHRGAAGAAAAVPAVHREPQAARLARRDSDEGTLSRHWREALKTALLVASGSALAVRGLLWPWYRPRPGALTAAVAAFGVSAFGAGLLLIPSRLSTGAALGVLLLGWTGLLALTTAVTRAYAEPHA